MVETGAVQLHQPMPIGITHHRIQHAARQLQRAGDLLRSARDSAFNGNLAWNTARYWEELHELLQEGATFLEIRGESFLSTRPDATGSEEPLAHPADAIALRWGAQEAPARTSTTAGAATLLREAATEFRTIIPTLVGEQVPLAVLQTMRKGGYRLWRTTTTATPTSTNEHVSEHVSHDDTNEPDGPANELRDLEGGDTTRDEQNAMAAEGGENTRPLQRFSLFGNATTPAENILTDSLVNDINAAGDMPTQAYDEEGATASTLPWGTAAFPSLEPARFRTSTTRLPLSTDQ
ncbi:unnamed protein product [Symbiodinium sp. CCMP2592]|nr:unnamed protein product [Symbiodinium sp. CCMP2592]